MSSEVPKDLTKTFLSHHHKQIFTLGQMLSNMLDKLEQMGFNPFEVYYAWMEQIYMQRFAFEDGNAEHLLKIVDKELFDHMLKYRRMNPKEKALEMELAFTCSDCKAGKHDHTGRCGKFIDIMSSGVIKRYCECLT